MKKILLSSITIGLLLVGCIDTKEETTQQVNELQEQRVKEQKTSLLDNAKQSITHTTNTIIEKTGNLVTDTTNNIIDKTEAIIEETETQTINQNLKDEVEGTVETITLQDEVSK